MIKHCKLSKTKKIIKNKTTHHRDSNPGKPLSSEYKTTLISTEPQRHTQIYREWKASINLKKSWHELLVSSVQNLDDDLEFQLSRSC